MTVMEISETPDPGTAESNTDDAGSERLDASAAAIDEAKEAARTLADHDVIDPDALETAPDFVDPDAPQP
jgi:hypothetical protein